MPALVIAVFLIACSGTWLARRYALHRQLVDQPGARRSHAVATPRGGGIAIVVAILLALSAAALGWPGLAPLLWLAAIGLVCVAGIGWIDDHRPLSPWSRLGVHVLAAGWLGAGVALVGAPIWIAAVVAMLALGLVNVWNFMDGINGLATSHAVSSATAFLAIALIAACLGFLPFNAPRARIFLGDVGSGALGYLIALLAALVLIEEARTGVLLALPLSAFLVDAALTLASRMLRGEQWWKPHVQHVYQQCVQRHHPHLRVAGAYLAWTVSAILLMTMTSDQPPAFIMVTTVTWYAFAVACWFWLRRRHRRWVAINAKDDAR
ncbi:MULTISPECIES: lipopolysaccharide biosynthesis protein [Luteimonas]|uniref:lipopolysaccharide biosynthesis protein n=1 Tax=Luteimonas TaxID=83614 RepID=UPI000C7C6564|nr:MULTISPECIES: lipopolysaccharide biosynthesis protein [Luteimonas]